MSIINEALKKARLEREARLSDPDREMVRRNLEIEMHHKKRPAVNWGPVFIVLVFILIAGPIAAPLFSTPTKRAGGPGLFAPGVPAQDVPADTALLAQAPAAALSSSKAQFGIEEMPVFGRPELAAVRSGADLRLSGIVYSPNDAFAIINDQIIKTGDQINSATVLAVNEKSVVLQRGRERQELSLGE